MRIGLLHLAVVLAIIVMASCGSCRSGPQGVVRDDPRANTASSTPERDAALARIEAAFAVSVVKDATLVVGRGEGAVVAFVKGQGGLDHVYFADSAQKWILATLLLREAKARGVTLEQPMSSWPKAPAWASGDVGATTLRDLLSFTAGFEDPPRCAGVPRGSFSSCLPKLVASPLVTPRRYFYGTHHMMVAMAGLGGEAANVDNLSREMLARFRQQTGLLATAEHEGDKPLKLEITPREYAAFLQALSLHKLLDVDDEAAMFKDQIGDRAIAYSPATRRGDGRWRYGLGNWVECPLNALDRAGPCSPHHHSAGARGFYPFVDVDTGVYGVIAHNARVGDWQDSDDLYGVIRGDLEAATRSP